MKQLVRPHGVWCGCPLIEEGSYPISLGCPNPSRPLTVIEHLILKKNKKEDE